MSNLTPELQAQIEQEGNGRAEGFETKLLASVAKTEYEIGAETYAVKWQAAEAEKVKLNRMLKSAVDTGKKAIDRAERYEKALNTILNTNHDNYERVICKVKTIAAEALTPKQTTDDTANA